MQRKRNKISGMIRPLTTVCLVALVWWLATSRGLVNPLFLPRIEATMEALVRLLSSQEVYFATASTSFRAVVGLILSAIVAVPLGLFFGRRPTLYEYVELPVDFFRSIPSSALFFLFILFFGIGDASKIAVVFYGCSLILLVNTIYGAKPTREKRDRINMLRSFGASRWQVFRLAIFRDALPHIVAGIRVCVSLSLVLVIVTEMFLSAKSGLGRQIYDFYLAYRVPEMYATIVILGIVGFAANQVCLSFERRTSFWKGNIL